ncbi:hypothetical protein SCA6_012534 [Theobroma cacao]
MGRTVRPPLQIAIRTRRRCSNITTWLLWSVRKSWQAEKYSRLMEQRTINNYILGLITASVNT